jgi:hypothetical protein
VFRDAVGAGWSSVISRQAATSGAEHYALALLDGKPTVIVASNQPGGHLCSGPATMPTGQWVHLAASYDGATARMYLNGIEVCNFARAVILGADTTPLILGGNANTAADEAQELWAGAIDEALTYSRALAPSEVAALAK